METNQYRNSSVVGGVALILLGLVFFAATQGAFNFNWGNIWPIFPMLAGGAVLALAFAGDNPRSRAGLVLGGTIPLLIGVFFFATTLGVLSWSDQGTLWPVYPLIVGVAFFAAYFASNREQTGFLIPGAILTLVALVFLAITLTDTSYSYIGKIWPIFLIIAGVLLLVLPRARTIQNR